MVSCLLLLLNLFFLLRLAFNDILRSFLVPNAGSPSTVCSMEATYVSDFRWWLQDSTDNFLLDSFIIAQLHHWRTIRPAGVQKFSQDPTPVFRLYGSSTSTRSFGFAEQRKAAPAVVVVVGLPSYSNREDACGCVKADDSLKRRTVQHVEQA